MELKLLMKSARSAVLEISDGGLYYTKEKYSLWVNGVCVKDVETVITSVFGLRPETEYEICLVREDASEAGRVRFTTEYEFVTLNVRDFGAKGDGLQDDTRFIQAAILCCPKDGRVLIPKGTYRITTLFLKSDLNLELQKGAVLLADTERFAYPRVPGLIESYDETNEYNLGSWEGNPLPMFTSIIMGVDVKNVFLYGEGTINGNASRENWWHNPKVMVGAFRPRMFFVNRCQNITLQGIKFCNSPSWTLHPYFSQDLRFYNVFVENPSDSPNTDGLDPESCKNVEIAGVRFSLGDDCIAVKSVPDGERARGGHAGQRDGRRREEPYGGGLPVPSYGQRASRQDEKRPGRGCSSRPDYLPQYRYGSCDDSFRGKQLLFLRPGREDGICAEQRAHGRGRENAKHQEAGV